MPFLHPCAVLTGHSPLSKTSPLTWDSGEDRRFRPVSLDVGILEEQSGVVQGEGVHIVEVKEGASPLSRGGGGGGFHRSVGSPSSVRQSGPFLHPLHSILQGTHSTCSSLPPSPPFAPSPLPLQVVWSEEEESHSWALSSNSPSPQNRQTPEREVTCPFLPPAPIPVGVFLDGSCGCAVHLVVESRLWFVLFHG